MDKNKEIDALSILLDCQNGTKDEYIWSKLTDILFKLTFKLSCSFLLTEQDREDLAQDVVLRIFTGVDTKFSISDKDRKTINLSKYLLGLMRNETRKYLKHTTRVDSKATFDHKEIDSYEENYELHYDLSKKITSLDRVSEDILNKVYLEGQSSRKVAKNSICKIGRTKVQEICRDFVKTLEMES